MGPWGFPHTKPGTWLLPWVTPPSGHCQRLRWQSAQTHGVAVNTSSSFKNETLVRDLHLSCGLQLSLIFSSVSSQQPHLCRGGNCYDGHHCQDEQGQLPAKNKGYDDTDAHVGEVLDERGHANACSLRKRVETKVEEVWRESRAAFSSTWSFSVWRVQRGRLTPWTWAASAASRVVSAPTLFMGLSNQPRSCQSWSQLIIKSLALNSLCLVYQNKTTC